jgi:molybdate/tungstate transport system substrate-binding protein
MNRLLDRRSTALLTGIGLLLAGGCHRSDRRADSSILVFNAGALALPLRQALDSFGPANGVTPSQESAGSVESVRKVTDLGRTPDIIAVADTTLFGTLLEGRLDGPIAVLGGSRLVLAYTGRSRYAAQVNARNWTDLTTRPGVEVGRSDPSLDPAGYRALMAMQLAERYYHQPGLAARLEHASPDRDMRPKSADLTALLQTGNLDYAWEYESVARTLGLRFISLPREVDLGDPSLAATYATASVDISASPSRSGATGAHTSLVMHGAPIVFGAATLKKSPHPTIARRFITYLMSPAGRSILASNGLRAPSQGVAADSR